MLAVVTALAVLGAPAAASAAFGPLSSFGSFGSGAGQLNGVSDVAVADDGRLYVGSFSNRRVDVFSPSGEFEFAFGKDIEPGSGDDGDRCDAVTGCEFGDGSGAAGALGGSEGLAFSPLNGNLYVADIANSRVDVLSPAGEFLFAFGKGVNAEDGSDVCTVQSGCLEGEVTEEAGSIGEPQGLGIDEDGTVYVADRINHRILAFDADGTFEFAFGGGVGGGDIDICTTVCEAGSEGGGAGEIVRPFDVKPGPGETLVVSNRGNNRIDVFSSAGVFQYAFGKGVNPNGGDVCTLECVAGGAGDGAGSVTPFALEVGGDGTVYVTDVRNDRLSQFSFAGSFQRSFGAGVVDGANVFQVCAPGGPCRKGVVGSTVAGAVSRSLGLGVSSEGVIYVPSQPAAQPGKAPFARVESFGELPVEPPVVNPPSPPRQPSPSNQFAFGALKLNARNGTAVLSVRVPGPGTVSLTGKGLRRTTAKLGEPGTVKLAVRLLGQAKRKLLATGRAKVKATVSYTPTGGSKASKSKSLTLKRVLRR
jgi:DNA-binding beta-propeller fold protein YncE